MDVRFYILFDYMNTLFPQLVGIIEVPLYSNLAIVIWLGGQVSRKLVFCVQYSASVVEIWTLLMTENN